MRILFLLLALLAVPAWAKPPTILAAASLQESLTEAAAAWAKAGHERPVLSFAASSALARQIDAGAPADLFISADEPWMDDVQKKGRVRPGTRIAFLANRLVLIAPAAAARPVAIRPGFPLAAMLGSGRLAMGEPASVPAGKYARQALTRLGIWPAVASKVAGAENVRAALALVERGEAPFGIVYATDALASRRVRIVGTFPTASHAPITYPVATLTTATSRDAEPFRRFLISDAGKAIFRRHGFQPR
ncbi:molybdate ABC transporter substrate-binding protein [uncultured Sphingomonas sp.]|uniref:molybdate ABC transporter substrate-binding protein n=1 Tax=uncultured Sphingomonas sp. TaxID=158754 RepID=UPI0025D4FB57|nr:molybdate ABC transporter substrate-binding protein [uncultured Sphingomonas sp.]